MINQAEHIVHNEYGSNWPHVRSRKVAFKYHHGKHGRLLQCDVFVRYMDDDKREGLLRVYTRPHVLDKDKLTKERGRTIALGRLAKILDLLDTGQFEKAIHTKGLRIYVVDENENVKLMWKPGKMKNKNTGNMSESRCEKISSDFLLRTFRKLSN